MTPISNRLQTGDVTDVQTGSNTDEMDDVTDVTDKSPGFGDEAPFEADPTDLEAGRYEYGRDDVS